MSHRSATRLGRWIVGLSLATYVSVAVLGYGLHSLLPCGDSGAAAHDCCCGHDHNDHGVPLESSKQGTRFAGKSDQPCHDADHCVLCTLLAKINVGYAAFEVADVRVELSTAAPVWRQHRLPADLILPAAARGPPSAC